MKNLILVFQFFSVNDLKISAKFRQHGSDCSRFTNMASGHLLDATLDNENHQFTSFDDFPKAPFLDWALDPETGIRYHENKLRFNMEIFDDEFSGFNTPTIF